MKIESRTRDDKLYRRVYMIWYNMMRRCYNKNYPQYKNYGAKGVYVSERWKNLNNFIEDIDSIDGFNEKEFNQGLLSLDKDAKLFENKEYSLEYCSFVLLSENNKIKPNQQKEFKATSPNNEVFVGFNQSDFARKHNLTQSKISSCLNKETKSHKGWSFKYI